MRIKTFKIVVFLVVLFIANLVNGQIVSAFNARYQANQKGGIVFLSNVSVTCTTGTTCTTAKAEVPPTGSYSNGSFTMNYVDIDSDASTFMSSSDSLNLPNCSEILFAGLYWSGRIATTTTNYSTRNRIKLKLNSGSYQTLAADNILDVPTISGSSWSHPSYYCFKNITSIVSAGGIKGRVTIADLVTQTGSTNLWGGWSIVVVYKNVFQSMRNLTVFDGFANVAIGNTLDIPISGFVTPPTGPVSFDLGVIALDGDRDSNGDQLQFKGGASFVNVSDGLHNSNNFFNSVISNFGVLSPHRNPSFNNTLGYDASIYSPTNTALNYIGNNATTATVRVTTSSENILTRVITSAIDVYEPDLRANVRISDLNGGLVNPGDILEYTLVGKNIGSDISMETFMTDTLDPRTVYVPGSISITHGPNLGAKTDATGDDQAEYIAASKTIKVRIGTGANTTLGGQVANSTTGADSTVIKFKVTVIDDCLMFQCDNTLDHKAYIFGEGNISGNSYNNDGDSDLYDSNGCPTTASNVLTINVATCPPPDLSSNGPICPGQTLQLFSEYSSDANYTWSGPNSFTSTLENPTISNVNTSNSGTYSLNYSFDGLDCIVDTSIVVTIYSAPTIQTSSFTNPTCYNANNGTASVTISGNSSVTYLWSTGATTSSISNLSAGTYTVTITGSNGCTSTQSFTLTQPLLLTASASVTSNYNGYNISCYNGTNGSAQVVASGGTSPYTYLWSNNATTSTLSSISAGTYSVTVTDSKGCTATSSVTLTQPTILQLSNANQTAIACFGGNTGAIDITVVGGVTNYTYAWSNAATSQDLSNLLAGNYSVTITDANGCTKTGAYTLTQPSTALSSSETHTTISCYNSATGSIDLTVAGGTSPYSYSWSNGSTSQDLSAIAAGTFTVTITDAKGCQTSRSVTITQPSSGLSVTSSSVNVSCFGGTNGSINITPSGGTLPYIYTWSNAATTEDLTSISAGNYSCVVKDANNCTSSVSVTITQPSTSIQFNVSSSNVSCFNGSNGSIALTPNGGTAPFVYTWSNGATTASITNITQGTYSVNVVDANGCPYTNTITITQPTLLGSSGVTTNVSCFGNSSGAINLSVSGGTSPYFYTWSNGATSEDINNLAAGTYTVNVHDNNNCTLSNSFTITEPTAPLSLNLTGVNILCYAAATGSVSSNVSGGTAPYTYSWNTGSANATLSNQLAGEYILNVTDHLGCNIQDSIDLTQPLQPLSINATSTNVLCYGDATGAIDISVNGGTILYNYSWSNASLTQDLNLIPAGTYTVNVVDANNCQIDTTIIITQPAAPLFATTVMDSVLCNGSSTGSIDLTIIGGTSPYTQLWNNGATTEDISHLQIGIYSVQITDANACQFVIQDTVYESSPIVINGTIQSVLCFNDASGAIAVSVSGGNSPYTYSWDNGATTNSISNLIAGTYSVTITDDYGCDTTVSYTVTQPVQALQLSEIHQNITCFGGNDGSINVTTTGGTIPYTYAWSNTEITEDIGSLTNGNYTLTITDNNNCSEQISVVLSQPILPIQLGSAPTNVNCFGQSTGAINLNVNGGTGIYNYSWSNGATTEDLSNLASGSYTVNLFDENNCTATTTVFISQPLAPLTLSETHQDAICISTVTGSIDLAVSGGTSPYNYQWDNGQITQDISALGEGLYSVEVTDNLGCQSNLSVQILDPDNLMQLSEIHTDVTCFGAANGAIDLTVTNGNPVASYTWNSGAATQDISNLTAGNYFVNVVDINGCTSFLAAVVDQPLAPLSASAVVTNALCFGQNTGAINVTTTGGTIPYSYVWNTGETTEDIGSLAAGNYSVIITDNNGCSKINNFTVNQANSLIQISSASSNVNCFAGNDGLINLTTSGGLAPYSYSWSNGSTTEDLTNIIAGNYNVNVQDANGCSEQLFFTISQPANGIQTNVVVQNVSCRNGTDGSIQLTVSGATPTYTYLWNTAATTEDLTNVSAGMYTVLITDANGCTKTVNAQITQPSSVLSVNSIGTNVLCYNGASGTAQVVASGGVPPYSYSWSNGETTTFIDSLIAGNYTVNVTDNSNCEVTSSLTITQPNPIFANTQHFNVVCYGQASGSITSNVTGGISPYIYSWNTGSTAANIQNLVAGPYFLDVTDANGCTVTFSDTIYQPSSGIDINSIVVDNICFGANEGSIDNTITGGTQPYQYLWNTTANTEDLAHLLAGNYTVTVLDANNCLMTELITVGQPATGITSQATVTDVLCFGQSTGSINLQAFGPNAPFSYAWTNGELTEDILNLSAGIYTVTITNTNGCQSAASFAVNQPNTPISYISNLTNVSCKYGNDGSIDIQPIGGVPPYTYSWSNGFGTQDISNLYAGNYNIIITDANGCQLNQTETINEPLLPLSATLSSTDVLCNGQSTGSVDVTVNGGTANYSFLWSNGVNAEDLTAIPQGYYNLVITDAANCSLNIDTMIYEPTSALSVVATIQNVNCIGSATGSIILNVSGGTPSYSYLRNTGETTDSLVNQLAGTYAVQITDSLGCTLNQNYTISQPTTPLTLTSNITNVSCFNGTSGSIVLNPNGGTAPYFYNWNNGSTTKDLANITAGTYTVTMTDANGCQVFQSFTVTQPNPINVSSVPYQVSCFGGNNGFIDASVNGGSGSFTYLWSNGATTEDIGNLIAGNYSFTVNDANGCSSSLNVTINQPAFATVLSGVITNALCFNSPNGAIDLTVQSATPGFTYSWNNGATTEDVQNITTGTYSVTVVDSNNCISSKTFVVGQATPILATATTTNVSCFEGSDGALSISVSGGTPNYNYNWSNGATTAQISNLQSGNYFLDVADSNNCHQTFNFTVNQPNDSLSLVANTVGTTCNGFSDGSIDITVSGGTTSYSYLWNNSSTTQDISNVPAGIYSVLVTDADGCTLTRNISVTEPQSLNISVNASNVLCFSDSTGSIDIEVFGGIEDYTYSWSNGETSQDIDSLSANNYYLIITDANGCIYTDSVQIQQPASALNIQLIATNVSCFGLNDGAVNMTIQGGVAPYVINWASGQITEDLQNIPAGVYVATVVDSNGCTVSDSINVLQPLAPLSVTATKGDVTCFNGSNGFIDITVAGGTFPYTYSWSNSVVSQDNLNVPQGSYTVTITDANNCQIQASYVIAHPASGMTLSGNVQNVTCFNGSDGAININVNGGYPTYTYLWSNAATTEDLSTITAGQYIVEVTDNSGCTIQDTFIVQQPNTGISINVVITNVSCYGGSNGAINLTTSGGSPNYAFNWNNTQITEDLLNLSAGAYSIHITDQLGCTLDSTITVTEPPVFVLTSTHTNVNCFGQSTGSIQIIPQGGTPNYTYLWSNGATTQNLNALPAGTYSVVVTDANNCTQTTSVTVTQPQLPLTVTETHQNIICFGGNNGSIDVSVIGGTAPYSYLWNNNQTTQDLSNLLAGTYSVNVTDANFCSSLISVTITQPASATTLTSNILSVKCYGNASGSIDLTVNGGTSPYTYLWNNGATTQDLYNVVAGIYSVTVTDNNNCVSNASYSISQPAAALNATYTTTPVTCYAGSDGTASLSITGGTVPYSIMWANGSTSNNLNGLQAGSYPVQVKDANGCVFVLTVVITQPQQLVSNFIADATSGCEPLTVNFTSVSIGTPTSCLWDFGNGQTSTNCNATSYTYTVPGCYNVSLTINGGPGCSSTQTFDSLVCVYPNPYASFNYVTAPDIFYSGNVDFTNLSVGGNAYTWTFGDNSPSSSLENPTHSYPHQIDTTYYVTLVVVDSNGCRDTAVNMVKIDPEFYVYVPNAFTVDDNDYNETFIPVFSDYSRIKKYKIMIFDRWGELIWETTDHHLPWDGRSNGKNVQDGVYTWKINYELYVDGSRTLAGHVVLLR
jgi:gliding motility-associated-like protein